MQAYVHARDMHKAQLIHKETDTNSEHMQALSAKCFEGVDQAKKRTNCLQASNLFTF